MRRVAFALILGVVALTAEQLIAQSLAQNPSFEVASVKRNNSGSTAASWSGNDESGHLKATNVSLRQFVIQAYGVLNFQLVGGPSWISTERFDIEARGDTGAMANARAEVMRQMLQSLLEERFQLKVHRETREQPVFILSVAKDGSKLRPTIEGGLGPDGSGLGSTRTSGTFAGVEMRGSGMTMDRLVNMLASSVGRPIIDQTNLTGMYDFTLKFASSAVPTAGADSATEPVGPSLFTAIQEQLGLRLESGKGLVEVLVIDSASEPSEN
jgi:uncharacterized protein (TIGR03435 family)